jgi:acyl-CoA reductase-like NAD-dependent aldehyde dehydrogenase
LKNGFFFEPTVLTGVEPDMGIFKEESLVGRMHQ